MDVVSCPVFLLVPHEFRHVCLQMSSLDTLLHVRALFIYEHVFVISLKATAPNPAAPGTTIGGGLDMKWNFGENQGTIKHGVDKDQKCVFFSFSQRWIPPLEVRIE